MPSTGRCTYQLLSAIFLDWRLSESSVLIISTIHAEAKVTACVINAIRYPTYIQLFYGEYRADGRYDERSATHMEIRIMYDNLAKLPHRRFAPPCRGLCGFDLHRWHVTCLLSCLLRRVHYRKMPARIPVQGYTLWIVKGRRLEPVKRALLKRVMTIAEQLAK